MAQHHNITTGAPLAAGRSLVLARALSIIFSPPLTAVAAWALVTLIQAASAWEGLRWMLVTTLIQLGPSAALYTHRRRTGAYGDADVSVRQERNELYLLGTLSVLASLGVLELLGAPPAFRALTATILAIGVVCGLINLVWKISMHAATIGTAATVGALYTPGLGVALWICALAVGWARVRTRNHTLLQVVAGLAVAALITVTVFALEFGR